MEKLQIYDRIKIINDYRCANGTLIPFGTIGTITMINENELTIRYISEYTKGFALIPSHYVGKLSLKELKNIPVSPFLMVSDMYAPENRFAITDFKNDTIEYGYISDIELNVNEKNDMFTVRVGTEIRTYSRLLFDEIASLANDDAEYHLDEISKSSQTPLDVCIPAKKTISSISDIPNKNASEEKLAIFSITIDNQQYSFKTKDGKIYLDPFEIKDINGIIESLGRLSAFFKGI